MTYFLLLAVLWPAVTLGLGLFLGAYLHKRNPIDETPMRPAIDEPDAVYYERTDIRV